MSEQVATQPEDRWNRWRLSGKPDGRASPTIRLVHAVRLWDDSVACDRDRATGAWREIQARMTIGVDAKLWEAEGPSDACIHELAPAPVALFEHARGMRLWRMSSQGRDKYGLSTHGKARWMLGLGSGAKRRAIAFRVTGAQLWASGDGIGYLAVDIEPSGSERDALPSVAEFLDALHYVRFLERDGASFDGSAFIDPRYSTQPPVPVQIGGFTVGDGWKAEGEPGTYSASFRVSSLYAALFHLLTGRDANAMRDAALENSATLRAFVFADVRSTSGDTQDPASELELLLQVAEMAHAKREIARLLDTGNTRSGVRHDEYAQGAYFAYSHECTAFLAFGQPNTPFWRQDMPHHVLNEYFAIQILTMYQRHLVDEVRRLAGSGNTDALGASEEALDQWWDRMQERAIDAKARGYFIEVSVRTNHARFESTLREVLQVDRAYDLAMGLVDSLCESQIARVEMRRERESRRREKFWQLVAGAALFPTVGLTVMNVNMPGLTTEKDGLPLITVLLYTGILMIVGLLFGALPNILRTFLRRC
jgi:hypothetical protein